MHPFLISLISASTALVASVVGPFVTLAVARRQFAATMLSANRQKWIETLRDMVAELISLQPARARSSALPPGDRHCVKALQSEETLEAEAEADIETITALAQSILKREWRRVKRGN